MAGRDLIPLMEAAERLGVSRMTLSRLAKDGRFTIYENPRDRRQKLVDAEEVREALLPKPMPEGKERAAA
jgi:excisionase family DNA binding protein